MGKRGMSIFVSDWAKIMKIFVSHRNAHQKVTSAEEDFNNPVDRVTHLWIQVRKGRQGCIMDHLN